jgi:hypothetical protein
VATSPSSSTGDRSAEVASSAPIGASSPWDETTEVGSDAGAPVSEDYGSGGNEFTGKVNWVRLDIDAAAADADHLISPEERFHIAMASSRSRAVDHSPEG